MEVFTRTNNGIDPAPFIALIEHVYGGYSFVVKSKIKEYLATIDPKNPAHHFGTITHIEIRDSTRLYAHASIVVDKRRSDVLFVGHFECTGDDEATNMLLKMVEKIARQKGVRSIVGPVDRSLWGTFRAPIDGDGILFFSEPYFPHFISKAFLREGYSVVQESESTLGRIPEPRLLPISTSTVICAHVTPKEIPSTLPAIFKIISVSFCDNPFFFPISFDEFCFSFTHHPDSVERAMPFVARSQGVIVGFLLGYRSPEAGPPGVVAKTMAILPEFRHMGIGSALFHMFYTHALAEKFEHVYYSTMQKSNSDIHILTNPGGLTSRHVREYGLFEKII